MSGKGLALTERDKRLLAEVRRFGVLTRDQTMRLRFFASKTRANERLKRLVDTGYLSARRQAVILGGPRLVYLPGRLLIDARGTRRRFGEASDVLLAHQLGLGDIRIALERATTVTQWRSEQELVDLALGVIPDAYLEYEVNTLTFCAFVEYDRGTETLSRLERKVKAYLDLAFSGRFTRTFSRRFFRLLLVTDTAGRLNTVSNAVARLTDRVVRLATLSELVTQGPLASIWRTPGTSTTQSLNP